MMCLVLRAVYRRNGRGIWLQVISLFIIMFQRTCVIPKRLPECNRCCFDVQPRKRKGKKGKKRRTSIYIWPLSVLSQPTAIKKYFLLWRRRRRRSSSVQRTEKYITGQRPASFFFCFFSLSTAYCTTNRAETSSSFHLDLFFFPPYVSQNINSLVWKS